MVTSTSNLPTQTGEGILIVTGNTNKTYYPKRLVTDKTGQMNTTEYSTNNDIHDDFNIHSRIKLKISNATASKGVTAYIYVEEF